MKTITIQQEVLLMTNTTFAQKQWCKKDDRDNSRQLSQAEILEEACWNGLLDEILPAMVIKPMAGKILYLWQIRHAKSFLQIQLCEYPEVYEKKYSIDPYSFLEFQSYN